MSVYELHSFHINIGTGDCSIHLLVDINDDSDDNGERKKQGRIHQAILVDGGEGTNKPVVSITKTMETITDTYNLPVKDEKLMFDSIIVTHWDRDHWAGMIGLLGSDLATSYDPNVAAIRDTKLSLLRYINGDPATILYAPTWKIQTKTVFESDKKTPKKDPTTGKNMKTESGPSKYLEADPPVTDKRYGSTKSQEVYMKLSPWKLKKQLGVIPRTDWPKVLLLKTGTDNLLGINFLNRNLPTARDQIHSPKILLAHNPLDNDLNQPGIYCVAVNGKGFDWVVKPPSTKIKKTVGIVDLVDKPSSSSGYRKNYISICCLVMWKNGRLSHYFAGDATWDVEEKVMEWTGTNGGKGSDEPAFTKAIACMKASHHGAVNSTPLKILDNFSPRHIIVSGGATIKHFHPRM
jgi:hypothetical protein